MYSGWMTHTFHAFIDESGDDGIGNFRIPMGRGGASHWLVISALIYRSINSLEAVAWRNEIIEKIGGKGKKDLHFKDLDHPKRVCAAQVLATKPVRSISVLAAKKPIPDDIYTSKNQLYFYMTRYLIERVSWFCRDMRQQAPEGDGRVAITFSRRGGMSYENFRAYLERLRASRDDAISIHWPVIDIDSVSAHDHSSSASLQLADVIASSFAASLEPNHFGNCELTYARILRPTVYHRGKKHLSYGVKFVPHHDECGLDRQQAEMVELFGGEVGSPPGHDCGKLAACSLSSALANSGA